MSKTTTDKTLEQVCWYWKQFGMGAVMRLGIMNNEIDVIQVDLYH